MLYNALIKCIEYLPLNNTNNELDFQVKCTLHGKNAGFFMLLPYKNCWKKRYKKKRCSKCIWFRQGELAFSGKDLKKFRDSRGWTLRQMSDAVGTSLKTLQVIEKEDRIVGLNLRLALAALKHGLHPIEDDQL
jgi:DNA-binding XRE family transcriptional regulator